MLVQDSVLTCVSVKSLDFISGQFPDVFVEDLLRLLCCVAFLSSLVKKPP